MTVIHRIAVASFILALGFAAASAADTFEVGLAGQEKTLLADIVKQQKRPPTPVMTAVSAFDGRYAPGSVVAGFMERVKQGGCTLNYSRVSPILEEDPEDEHPSYAFGSYPFHEKWTCDGKPYLCEGYVSMDGAQPRFLFLSVNYSAQKLR